MFAAQKAIFGKIHSNGKKPRGKWRRPSVRMMTAKYAEARRRIELAGECWTTVNSLKADKIIAFFERIEKGQSDGKGDGQRKGSLGAV